MEIKFGTSKGGYKFQWNTLIVGETYILIPKPKSGIFFSEEEKRVIKNDLNELKNGKKMYPGTSGVLFLPGIEFDLQKAISAVEDYGK